MLVLRRAGGPTNASHPAEKWGRLVSGLDRRGWVVLGLAPLVPPILINLLKSPACHAATLIPVFAFLQLTLLLKQFPIKLNGSTYDLEPTAFFASLVAIGPFWSVFNSLVGIVWYEWFVTKTLPQHRKVWQNLFNVENTLLSAGAAAVLYSVLFPRAGALVSLFLSGAAAVIINDTLVNVYFAVLDGTTVAVAWSRNESPATTLFYLIAYLPIGFLLGKLFFVSPLLVFLFIPPLISLWYFSKLTFEVKQKADAPLQTMGDILEERDEYTFGHTLRVADYACMIARDLGLPPDQIELCARVARIHDIGKIVVHDDVLKKEGALSQDEYRHIQEHVRIIPSLFRHMDHFGKLLHLAMLHHERYDGRGYPVGLRGEEIPLVIRVISVADAWDAMTSTRVYRKALTVERALAILRQGSECQWDPVVVQAALNLFGGTERIQAADRGAEKLFSGHDHREKMAPQTV